MPYTAATVRKILKERQMSEFFKFEGIVKEHKPQKRYIVRFGLINWKSGEYIKQDIYPNGTQYFRNKDDARKFADQLRKRYGNILEYSILIEGRLT